MPYMTDVPRAGWYTECVGVYRWGTPGGSSKAVVRFDVASDSYYMEHAGLALHGFIYVTDAMAAAEKTFKLWNEHGGTARARAKSSASTSTK